MDNYNTSSYPQGNNYPYRQPYPPPENPHTGVKIMLIIAGAAVVIAVMIILALVFMNRNTPSSAETAAVQTTAEATAFPTAAKAKMPDLTGLSKEDAIARLAAMGVTVSEIKETETGSAKPGYVFNQVPQKDHDVAPGDSVTLYVAVQKQTTAPPTTVPPTQAPTKRLYCTASDFVSLRTGKSADYQKLAKIPRGAEMLLLNGTDAWYYVRYNGLEGYVYSGYVSETPPPALQQQQTAAAATYLYCNAATYVSLRTGKGTDYTELARIPSRAGMEYLYQSGDWYYVRYNGKEGYVYGAYVSADPNAPINYSGSDY